MGVSDQSALVVLAQRDDVVEKSARNLPNVKMLLGNYLNIQDLLGHDLVILSRDSVDLIHVWLE